MDSQQPKELAFFETAYKGYDSFPDDVKQDGGYQLHLLQIGREPADFKPFPQVGAGVYELRLDDEQNEYRVMYVTKLGGKVWVLHAFQKKTRATRKSDIDIAKSAYSALESMLLKERVAEKKLKGRTPK